MMKLYICPDCKRLVLASRRVSVSCTRCGRENMPVTRLTFLEYSEMSEQARMEYVDQWVKKEKKR